jgi:hypothetical protein
MSITGVSSASMSVYLQYLTGSKSKDDTSIADLLSSVYGTGSTSTSSSALSYLEQAAEGTVLTGTGQKAAQAELKANIYGSLFDFSA